MRTTIDKHSLIAAWPLYALLAALLILGGYFLGAWENQPKPVDGLTIPNCVFEDGSGFTNPEVCYWDGTTRGNGIGERIIVEPDGATIRLP